MRKPIIPIKAIKPYQTESEWLWWLSVWCSRSSWVLFAKWWSDWDENAYNKIIKFSTEWTNQLTCGNKCSNASEVNVPIAKPTNTWLILLWRSCWRQGKRITIINPATLITSTEIVPYIKMSIFLGIENFTFFYNSK